MNNEGHIGYRETIALISVVLINKVFLTFPRSLVIEGSTAGWMIPLVNLGFVAVAFLPALALMKAHPKQTFIEIAEDYGGSFAAILVSLIFFVLFFLTATLIMREFAETFIVTLLPATPISVITILLLLVMVYASYQGIESLARGAWLLVPFIVVGVFGVLALVLPQSDPDGIFPFWGTGPLNIIKAGIFKTSIFGEILLLTLLNPTLRERDKLNYIVGISMIISAALLTFTIMISLMVYGSPEAATSGTYPLYNLARLIYLGRFMQKVESIFIFIWVFSMLAKVSVLFYGAAISLARGFKIPFYRPLLFPLAVLAYGTNFMIPNFVTAVWLDIHFLSEYVWTLSLALPTIIWLLYKLRGQGGTEDAQPQSSS